MKKWIVVALCALFTQMNGAELVHLTDANFDQTVASGLVVIDFHAKWCPPCRKFGPVFEAVAHQMNEKVLFATVDVDQAKNVSRELGIKSIPAIVVMKNGKEVARKVGSLTSTELEQLIRQHLK